MAYFNSETVETWVNLVDVFMESNSSATRFDVLTGQDAWMLAHRSGITKAAYEDRKVTDAHIKTALSHIFPNAVFKDKYTY